MSTEEQLGLFAQLETPFYYYNMGLLRETLDALTKAADPFGYKVYYALKANADDRILKMVREAGLGADCVSGNEIGKALEQGFNPGDIVFAGVGKTDREIILGLSAGIGCFNVESEEELDVIIQLAREKKAVAPVALRLNPGVDAHTHKFITTGMVQNKFGILPENLSAVLHKVKDTDHIHFKGIHVHIGSQILDMAVYETLCHRLNDLLQVVRKEGMNCGMINLGGGLGIDYENPSEYPVADFGGLFETVHRNLHVLPGQEVHFELGRSVVGQMGDLITRVLYVKRQGGQQFIILDAGMTELIRPALYGAAHKIENLSYRERSGENLPLDHYDIVGPVCETSDTFARDLPFPATCRGDIITIRSAGAYARMMASKYNLRSIAGVVYSDLPGTLTT
ncbi:MAG: diaminopimelate decarboxylase [Chlorobi bacterium]|nr:diaminopimelate decarboxylase [Chlorobiota bacterium]